ncbi:MAG: Mu transposase domain-containing protein [Parasutterella sp.]
MYSLPTYPYEICEWKILMVDKSHCVRISQDGGHRYSVPIDFIHKPVFVRLSREEVQIYSTADNKLIGRHVRQYSLKGEKTHLLEEHMTQAEKDRRRSPEYFIEKLTKRGVLRKAAEDFVYGSWGLSGDFVSRQRLHAIVRNLLPAYRPSFAL